MKSFLYIYQNKKVTDIEDNVMLHLMRKFYILQQKSAVSTIGQISALRFVDANPVTSLICSKHFIISMQLAKLCRAWIGNRNTGFLDNKNLITDNTG